jgi:hypothetical protein
MFTVSLRQAKMNKIADWMADSPKPLSIIFQITSMITSHFANLISDRSIKRLKE